jgi:glycosyltransferase involved in cell wall biosynthesis
LLLRAFIDLPGDHTSSLIICGYGPLSNSDRTLIESDPRIRFFGTVSKSDLNGLREKADILVNPRLLIADNVFNFPSKLLEYMSYQKIIVSTKTPGIPNDFSGTMILTNDSVSDFSASLLQAAQMTEEQRKPILNQLAIYSATHTWFHEAKRLIAFINTLNEEPR